LLYVSVGSQSNVADTVEILPKKTSAEIAAWDSEKGLGAAWGQEENRASVMVFEVGNEAATGRLFATGIRNCVGLTVQPQTGDVWCSTNERDQLGDDLVPDYSTRVPEGSFFGWPWYYMGDNEDPRHAGARPDLVGKIRQPDVPYTAQSAAAALRSRLSTPARASRYCMVPGTAPTAPATRLCRCPSSTANPPASTSTSSPASSPRTATCGDARSPSTSQKMVRCC
jgi:hypothetical protein